VSNLPIGILLAAGQSSRFGANKLLHPVADDTPMLIISAKALTSVLPGSVAVINQRLASYTPQLEELGMKVVINKHAESGIGSSIACGIRACEHASEYFSGWLIALADMPYIKPDTISLLAEKMRGGADIVAPVYKYQRGHPVGFSHPYQSELMALNEDVGARDIINRHLDKLELVMVNDAGVIKDIDHASELSESG